MAPRTLPQSAYCTYPTLPPSRSWPHAAPSSTSTNDEPVSSCGASAGKSPAHLEAARALARVFHDNGIHLVYGGGTVGVMGELAKALVALSGPGAVHGIIPAALMKFERKYEEDGKDAAVAADPQRVIDEKTYGRTTVVRDMHTRKQMMAREVIEGGPLSGFLTLSGGYGTLEECMEMVTWNQLGIHGRPVVLFNVDGYWDGLLQWVRTAVDAGFISGANSGILAEAKSADEVMERLRNYQNSQGRFKLHWGEK